MAYDMYPQTPDATLYDGDGGAYYAWTPAKSPMLSEASLCAGKLVLKPRGFTLPHYADVSKIIYVVQGTCTVGLVLPNSTRENVIVIKEGDAIPVAMGSLSWWFNGGDSDVVMIYLGESKYSYNPGQIDKFFLSGARGALRGFSIEFITKIHGFSDTKISERIANSQTAWLCVKLDGEIKMPESNSDAKEYVVNLVDSIRGEVTGDRLELLDKIGLSGSLVRVGPGYVSGPSYSTDGSDRIMYVVKGGGRVQIVGLNGMLALDKELTKDELFVVPRFFAVALLAGEQGMEVYSVATSSRPVMEQLAGNSSAWKALSSPVIQASLNLSRTEVKLILSNLQN